MTLQRVHSLTSPQLRQTDGMQSPAPPQATGPLGSGNHDQPIFRLNLMRALQLHRRMAIGFAVGGLLLAVAYVIKAWPVYLAESHVYVQPVQSRVMASGVDSSLMTNAAAYDSFVQQQVQSASNPDVLIAAIHKLKPGSFQRNGETEQAAAARLGGIITVARVGTSYEVAIAAKAKDPQLVADIANAVATSVVERASGEGNAGNAQRITILQDERKRIQDALTADYAEQNDLNKQLGMAAVGTEAPDLIDADIGRTREELIKAQTEHDEAEARFAAMGAGKGSSSTAIDAEADELVAADAGLTSMKTSLNARRAALITVMANMTPNNPEYKQDAAELAKINTSLDTMMKELRAKASARIQQRLRTDLERTAGVESRLNGQLRTLAGTAASATPKLQRASDLATDINRLRLRFSNVDEQLHNLMLDGNSPGALHISVVAVPPLHPAVAGILKKALPCIFGGLILGLLAASIANHLDSKVYIAADIEQAMGFSPMAVLPDFDEVSEEVSAEHLLRLSAAIEHARKQGNLDNCIFTGTSSGVGVTTLVTRVRDILKAMGRATVLLDSSGTPPPAPRANTTADQPASQRGSRSTALLRQVAAETDTEEENLVLTDTAPLLISAETEYLARFVDCAIVVVESGVTTRAQMLAAATTLQRLDVAAVGFVLNRVKLAKADPAFRNSVLEIDKHHRAQSTSASRRAERTSPAPEQPSQATKELPRESVVVAHESSPDADRNGRTSSASRPPVTPVWTTTSSAKPRPSQSSKSATSRLDAELPWWLSDEPGNTPPKPSRIDHPFESAARDDAQTQAEPVPQVTPVLQPHVVPFHPPASAPISEVEPREESSSSPLIAEVPSIATAEKPAPTPTLVQPVPPVVIETTASVTAKVPASSIAEEGLSPAAEKLPPSVIEPVISVIAAKATPAAVESILPVALPEAKPIVAEPITPKMVVPVPPAVAAKATPIVVPPLAPVVSTPSVAHAAEPVAAVDAPAAKPTTPHESHEDHQESVALQAASRLDPLRSMMFSLGLKKLNRAKQGDSGKNGNAASITDQSDRAVIERTLSQFAGPVPVEAAPAVVVPTNGPVRSVTTEPEFLPPKEFVPVNESEAAPRSPADSLFRNEESFDDVHTLPSRRGQYKRRG